MRRIMKKHNEYTLLLGRYQCLPPYEGHCGLVRALLDEGKNVIIGLRQEDGSESNPYTHEQRAKEFNKIFKKEIKSGRVMILYLPDIVEIAYGRTPGWKIKEIKLDHKTEKISATHIRKKRNI